MEILDDLINNIYNESSCLDTEKGHKKHVKKCRKNTALRPYD